MDPLTIVLGGVVTLLTGERGIQWYRTWAARQREEREGVAEREDRVATAIWDMYVAERQRAEQLVAQCSELQDELHRMERSATSEHDRRCRCEQELARLEGELAGCLARIAELEAQLRSERQTHALMLADVMGRTLGQPPPSSREMATTSPEPRPYPLSDDHDVDDDATTWRMDTEPPEEP